MITSRTPLRISLGGGGTDLPSYYENSGEGFLVAAAITKYVYVTVHDNFVDRYLLKYSRIEDVATTGEIEHRLIRAALEHLEMGPGIEITSIADIPAGTGLGSSGSFAVGLLKALYARRRTFVENQVIAAQACELEISVLREPVGKQDPYIAAVGGVTAFLFRADGGVEIESVRIPDAARAELDDGLTLFYTGVSRSASDELRALDKGAGESDAFYVKNLDRVRAAGYSAKEALEAGDIAALGDMLTEQWQLKLARSPSQIHRDIDEVITAGRQAGARGGKLVGAGGGGFLLFLASDRASLRARMSDLGLREVPIGLDYRGAVLGA